MVAPKVGSNQQTDPLANGRKVVLAKLALGEGS